MGKTFFKSSIEIDMINTFEGTFRRNTVFDVRIVSS